MSLPDDTCLELSIDISAFLELAIELPGGVSLRAQLEPGEFPNLGVIVGKLLAPLNAAITPLMPFFRILDVVLALIECVKAIPDSLGPPPDPTVIIKAIGKLVAKASFLLKLVPVLSIPIMIVGICKVIVAMLLALVLELEFQIEQSLKLDLAREKADGLSLDLDLAGGAAALMASIDCAQVDLDLAFELASASLGPLNKFIDVVNLLMDLAGLPQLISIEAGVSASAMLDPLKAAIEAIGAICGSIPV